MSRKALNRPVGKALLRFFGLLGATLSGLWVIGTILQALAAILGGDVEASAAQMMIGKVAGSVLVFVFFVSVFQRAGRTPEAEETRRRPSRIVIAVVAIFAIIMGGARLLAMTQPRASTGLNETPSAVSPKTASVSTPPTEPAPVFVPVKDGWCPPHYRMVEDVCALDGYLAGPALLEAIEGYKRGVAPMRMLPPTKTLPETGEPSATGTLPETGEPSATGTLPETGEPSAQDGEMDDWVTFESANERFKADFPTAPKREVVPTETAAGILNLIAYSAESEGFAYIAACVKAPEPVARQLRPESALDNARDGAVQNSGGTLLRETRIQTNGVNGRELLIATEEGAVLTRLRAYYVHQQLYVVEVATKSDRASDPNVARFLDSFAFTD